MSIEKISLTLSQAREKHREFLNKPSSEKLIIETNGEERLLAGHSIYLANELNDDETPKIQENPTDESIELSFDLWWESL